MERATDKGEQQRIDRLNRAAASEKKSSDPQAAGPRDVRPLIMMICSALAAAVIVLGLMWVNNARHYGPDYTPIAQRR